MVRIDGDPSVWHLLPAPLAAELGWTIASFGHLEDMLKRAIFALDRDRLSGGIREREFRDWLRRMDHVAADSLGTLIERLERTLAREGRSDRELMADLDEIKTWRNLLCHAAWREAEGTAGGWQPVFANTRGEVYDGVIAASDLAAIRAMTLDAAARARRLIEALDDHGNGVSD